MARTTPLQQVNKDHGGKDKLVDKLVDLLDRGDEDKASFRRRLLAAPNSKLLRLHNTVNEIKERFGSRDGLVDALLGLMNRAKDGDYRAKLQSLTPVRLMGLHRAWEKKSRASAS
jgi:hypothetical protein